jgi:hypothetical protein
MAAGTKAARNRQWAVNAILAAMRTNSPSDQETLFWIAHDIELAQKAKHRFGAPSRRSGRAASSVSVFS